MTTTTAFVIAAVAVAFEWIGRIIHLRQIRQEAADWKREAELWRLRAKHSEKEEDEFFWLLVKSVPAIITCREGRDPEDHHCIWTLKEVFQCDDEMASLLLSAAMDRDRGFGRQVVRTTVWDGCLGMDWMRERR